MECRVNIILKKTAEKDYCVLANDMADPGMIKMDVYTSGKKPIEFPKLKYFSLLDENLLGDFMAHFSDGKRIIPNADGICVFHDDREDKNTKEQNEELLEVIKLNKLENTRLIVATGFLDLKKEDIDSISPFLDYERVYIPFTGTEIRHPAYLLTALYEVIDETIRRMKTHDFTTLEKVLYAYDMIKTELMINSTQTKEITRLFGEATEPSYCYSLLFSQVLSRLGIDSILSAGEFYKTGVHCTVVARITDPEYDVDGMFYFDVSQDSKQRFLNSLANFPEDAINKELINNYGGFCKSKEHMIHRCSLDADSAFGIFNKNFMEAYDQYAQKYGINGVYRLRNIINRVGYFIDGTTTIDEYHGIKDEAELEEIRDKTERYAKLFDCDIDGATFLELIFNVRQAEYTECKKVFPLSMDALRECVFKSKFSFIGMNLEFPEEEEVEQEDIDQKISEEFDMQFDKTAENIKIEDKIRKLKLALSSQNDDKK